MKSTFRRWQVPPDPSTIRLRLLKIGAQVRISVRRVWVSFSDSFPNAAVFRQALARIRGPALAPSSP